MTESFYDSVEIERSTSNVSLSNSNLCVTFLLVPGLRMLSLIFPLPDRVLESLRVT